MAEDMTEKVLGLTVLVIVGIAVGIYLTNLYLVEGQQIQTVTLEQVTFTGAGSTDNLANLRPVRGSFTLVNATCLPPFTCGVGGNGSLMREGSEYTVTTSPTLGYLTSTNVTGTYNASYQYLPAQYAGGTAGTIFTIGATIFAVVLFVMIVRRLFGNDAD